jgi:hypothetical protein
MRCTLPISAFSLLPGSSPARGSSAVSGMSTNRVSIAACRPSVMTESRMSSPFSTRPLRSSILRMRSASTVW